MSSAVRQGKPGLRYRRDVRPLHFPGEEREDEKVPERLIHLRMRTALWQIMQRAYGREHATGSEQFIYFNARDPRRCCAPDAWLKLGARAPSSEVDVEGRDLLFTPVEAAEGRIAELEAELERERGLARPGGR